MIPQRQSIVAIPAKVCAAAFWAWRHAPQIVTTALLLVLFFCFVGQTALLLINQRAHRRIAEI